MVNLTGVFINDNQPPHDPIMKNGRGTYDPTSGKLEVEPGDLKMAPNEKERYFVGSDHKNFPDALCTAVLDPGGPFFFKERNR